MNTSPHLLCMGYGYTASYLAHMLLLEGWHVTGTCRTEDKQAHLTTQGINALCFNPEENQIPDKIWQDVTHLLLSIPPDEDGDKVLEHYQKYILSSPSLQWVGYLSTTGVYGDHQGGWVDETTPTSPPNARSQRRVGAENAWLTLYKAHQLPVHIFRLSGIYGSGKGRNALEAVQDGTAKRIDKPGQYFSRIHVEDIARILYASIQHPTPGEIYNIADDLPAPQADVVTYASELLGVTPPPLIPFDKAALSPMARSFYQSSRRVSNQKVKNKLNISLNYPTYKEGLHTILDKSCK